MVTALQRTGTTLVGSSHQQDHLEEAGSLSGWARNGSLDNPDVGNVNESDYQDVFYVVGLGVPLVTNNSHQLDEMESRFNELVDRWQNETGMLSSVARKTAHPAYLEIIDMGRPAIPLILEELIQRPNHWSVALRAITGENPVSPDDAGYIQHVANAWIQWGTERGYIGELWTWNPVKNLDSLTLSATNTK